MMKRELCAAPYCRLTAKFAVWPSEGGEGIIPSCWRHIASFVVEEMKPLRGRKDGTCVCVLPIEEL